jgi:hypothetical protein
MNRKIRTVALLLVAVFSLTAVAASSASAASSLKTPGHTKSKIEGTQSETQKLTLTASGTTVKCTTSSIVGTAETEEIKALEVTPTYSGCTLGGLTATIATNSCKYNILSSATALTATAVVTGCSGSGLTITQGSCVITIGNQTPGGTIVFANSSGVTPSDVTAKLGITGVAYSGSSGCPTNVSGSHTDGDLTGSYTVKAFETASPFSQIALTAS